jgi:hypothetical protein
MTAASAMVVTDTTRPNAFQLGRGDALPHCTI